jgi:predicted lipid-binding transport protein (Tim44 family)
MKSMRLIAMCIVLCVVGSPVLSFAKAGGGYRGGGGYSGSKGGGMGSRGSRTYDQNGYKPIERSTTPTQPSNAANPTQSTGRAGSPPNAPPPQVAQPSFLQRHPLLSGLAAGIAGSWIGHMLFGATDTSARSNDGTVNDSQEGENPGGSSGSTGMLLLLIALGLGTWYYFSKARRTDNPIPAFPGLERTNTGLITMPGSVQPSSLGTLKDSPDSTADITPADEKQFRELLVQVQTAWSRQDVSTLAKVTTPEMFHYLTDELSDNVSREISNHVEDVVVIHADLREAWAENDRVYATVLLRWQARDYTVSLVKQQGEAGYLIEGDDRLPTEATEAWTFVKHRNGKWLLSGIQQVE